MGLLSKVLGLFAHKQEPVETTDYFSTFTSYSPMFTSFDGGIYEAQLTRAAVERYALACSKLKPEVLGSAKPKVHRAIKTAPNQYMSWSVFLARVATILEVDTTAYVVPSFDDRGEITGVWPLRAEVAEIVEYAGEPWVRFTFEAGENLITGNRAALPLSEVCILTRFQYDSDFFGSGNGPINSTLKLMSMQDQSQIEAMKTAPALRFIGKLSSAVRPEDIKQKRKVFSDDNLSANNTSGILVYDQTWDDVRQLEPKSYTVPVEEMQRIDSNVYSYFGTNEDILQNKYTEDVWGAYYEGKVEPFAIQLGEGLTRILYSERERIAGNRIMFSSNRLEYASNASKRNMVRDMLDRGVMTLDDARAVLQLPPLPDGKGNVYVIRGEYYMLDSELKLIYASGGDRSDVSRQDPDNGSIAENDFDLGGDDDIYNDTDGRGSKEEDD